MSGIPVQSQIKRSLGAFDRRYLSRACVNDYGGCAVNRVCVLIHSRTHIVHHLSGVNRTIGTTPRPTKRSALSKCSQALYHNYSTVYGEEEAIGGNTRSKWTSTCKSNVPPRQEPRDQRHSTEKYGEATEEEETKRQCEQYIAGQTTSVGE